MVESVHTAQGFFSIILKLLSISFFNISAIAGILLKPQDVKFFL